MMYLLAFIAFVLQVAAFPTVTSLQHNGHFVADQAQCNITTTQNEKIANCSYRNLTGATISNVPPDVTVLIFSHNRLLTFDIHTFPELRHLKILNVEYCRIKNVTKYAFIRFPVLKELYFGGNAIRDMTKLMEALSNKTTLKKLNIAATRLGNVGAKTFELLPKGLESLNLAANRIYTLGEKTFSRFALNSLNLDYNNIRQFNFNAAGLMSLQKLHLRGNLIGDIDDICSSTNTTVALRHLDIANNLIPFLRFNRKCLDNLTSLIVDGNPLRLIEGNMFAKFRKLCNLSIDYIVSRTINVSDKAFNSKSLEGLKLGIQTGQLKPSDVLMKNIFGNSPNLKRLTLKNFGMLNFNKTQLTKIFHNLTKLIELRIDHGFLTEIPDDLISNMPKLKLLSFRGNFLTKWNPRVFEGATALRTLILSINQITHINKASLPAPLWDQLEVIDLAYNPFDCTCELFWFRQWIKTSKTILKSFPRFYYCKSPTEWKNAKLKSYDPSYLHCHHLSQAATALLVAGSVLVVAIVTVFVLNKCKWHIKYHLYLLRARGGYERIPDGDEFVYDAYVSNDTADRIWVFSKLREVLEKQHKLRLCLNERDFNVGSTIVDNITDNMKVSRKIILVLSNNYSKSQWCQFETEIAQMRFVETGTSSLILILLEDIKTKNMSNSLRHMLQSMKYIEWTTDKTGKELFWSELLSSVNSGRVN